MQRGHKITFRVNETAKRNLDLYCQIQGVELSELARSAVADKISPLVFNQLSVGHVSDTASHTRTSSVERTSKEVQSCRTLVGLQDWINEFWEACENKMFRPRLAKAVKDKWEELEELDPKELAAKFNEYNRSLSQGATLSHPNSWIAGGGWLNQAEPPSAADLFEEDF